MKKALGLIAVGVATVGVATLVAIKLEEKKVKRELQEKNPEELIKLLSDAALVLEMEQIVELDDDNKEKFEKIKEKIKARVAE